MNKIVEELRELSLVEKDLSEEAVIQVKNAVAEFVEHGGSDDIQSCLTFIVRLVYNGGYNQAVQDAIDVILDGESYSWEELQHLKTGKTVGERVEENTMGTCDVCNGMGMVECEDCAGTGWITTESGKKEFCPTCIYDGELACPTCKKGVSHE